MSRDIPIIFSGPMVSAFLAGRKGMTRRLAWREKIMAEPNQVKVSPTPWQKVVAGDRLWVRENLTRSPERHWRYSADGTVILMHRDDPRCAPMVTWAHHYDHAAAPSIHMPRWASRLTLLVTATKIERLNDMSDEDALAEGVVAHPTLGFHVPGIDHPNADFPILSRPSPREMFAALWDTLHGSGQWLANPEVVALTVRVIKANIDAPEARAA